MKNSGRKRLWKRIKFYLGVWGGYYLLRFFFFFSRNQAVDFEKYEMLRQSDRSIVLVVWHGQMLAPIFQLRNLGIHAMVGYHRDAEIIARILHRLGYEMIRGSSRDRGKEALKKALDIAENPENTVAITTDGPIGPYRKCKPGAAIISLAKGSVVLPLASNSSRKKIIKNSWDRFFLPLPFGRHVTLFGDPIYPEDAKGTGEEQQQNMINLIESQLTKLQHEADQLYPE